MGRAKNIAEGRKPVISNVGEVSMEKVVFIVFLLLGIPLAIDIGGKLRGEKKLQSKELFIIAIYFFGFAISGVQMTTKEIEDGYQPIQQPIAQENTANDNAHHMQPQEGIVVDEDNSDSEVSEGTKENALEEYELLTNDLGFFFSQFDKSYELGVYYVCAGRYDIICDMQKTPKDAEAILKQLTEFIVEKGYRHNIMSITLNVEQSGGRKNIVVVEDFSSESLPYVGYALYKNGFVTETTMSMNIDVLVNQHRP